MPTGIVSHKAFLQIPAGQAICDIYATQTPQRSHKCLSCTFQMKKQSTLSQPVLCVDEKRPCTNGSNALCILMACQLIVNVKLILLLKYTLDCLFHYC